MAKKKKDEVKQVNPKKAVKKTTAKKPTKTVSKKKKAVVKKKEATPLVPVQQTTPEVALAKLQQPKQVAVPLTKHHINILKDTYAKELTDAEFEMFIAIARASGLNPILGEMTVMKVQDRMVPITTIEGLRKLTHDIPVEHWKYEWAKEVDGKIEWREAWLPKWGNPDAARFCARVKGSQEYTCFPADWDSYVRVTKQGQVHTMWRKFGARMLAKCAEAGWRRLMKQSDILNFYIDAEMEQVLNVPALEEQKKKALDHKKEIPAMQSEQGKEAMIETFAKQYPVDKKDRKKALISVFTYLTEMDYTKDEAYTFIAKFKSSGDKQIFPDEIHFSKMECPELQEAIAIVAYWDALRGKEYKKKRANQAATEQNLEEEKTKGEVRWVAQEPDHDISDGIYSVLSAKLIQAISEEVFLAGEPFPDFARKFLKDGKKAGTSNSKLLATLTGEVLKYTQDLDKKLIDDLKVEGLIVRKVIKET